MSLEKSKIVGNGFQVFHATNNPYQSLLKGAGHAGDIDQKFVDLRLGRRVPVFYDPKKREVSRLGDPTQRLWSLLVLTVS